MQWDRYCHQKLFNLHPGFIINLYICSMDEKEKFYRALRYLIYLVMVAIALCLIVPMVWFFIESRSMGGF